MVEVFGIVMDNLFVWLLPACFSGAMWEGWSRKPGFRIAKVHIQICLYWIILTYLLLKWPLMNIPSSPSLIMTVLLAKTEYWFSTPFPAIAFVSYICLKSSSAQHKYPKHTAVPSLKPMKTILYFLDCFHSCWAIAQVSLPSFFKGLPGTSFFKIRFLVKFFRKDSDFFLNLYLCFARISPKQH